jgi:hypothetical protein
MPRVEALDRMRKTGESGIAPRALARAALLSVPVVALAVVPVFISTVSGRAFGMPPIMWWIVLWIALTPPCLLGAERLRPR